MRLVFDSKVVMLHLSFPLIAECGGNQEQDTHAHGNAEKSMEIPNSYAAAVEQRDFHLVEIGEL